MPALPALLALAGCCGIPHNFRCMDIVEFRDTQPALQLASVLTLFLMVFLMLYVSGCVGSVVVQSVTLQLC